MDAEAKIEFIVLAFCFAIMIIILAGTLYGTHICTSIPANAVVRPVNSTRAPKGYVCK